MNINADMMYACMHACMHAYNTIQYITLHQLQSIVTLHYITLRYVIKLCYVTLQHVQYITLHCLTLQYCTVHYLHTDVPSHILTHIYTHMDDSVLCTYLSIYLSIGQSSQLAIYLLALGHMRMCVYHIYIYIHIYIYEYTNTARPVTPDRPPSTEPEPGGGSVAQGHGRSPCQRSAYREQSNLQFQ